MSESTAGITPTLVRSSVDSIRDPTRVGEVGIEGQPASEAASSAHPSQRDSVIESLFDAHQHSHGRDRSSQGTDTPFRHDGLTKGTSSSSSPPPSATHHHHPTISLQIPARAAAITSAAPSSSSPGDSLSAASPASFGAVSSVGASSADLGTTTVSASPETPFSPAESQAIPVETPPISSASSSSSALGPTSSSTGADSAADACSSAHAKYASTGDRQGSLSFSSPRSPGQRQAFPSLGSFSEESLVGKDSRVAFSSPQGSSSQVVQAPSPSGGHSPSPGLGVSPSTGGFFSSLLPSSPKVTATEREDSNRRKAEDKSGRTARDRHAEGSTSKTRRPSSVFEHVGSVFERFGKRVHSRSESKGSDGSAASRKPSNLTRVSQWSTLNGDSNGWAAVTSASDLTGSAVEEDLEGPSCLSPSASCSNIHSMRRDSRDDDALSLRGSEASYIGSSESIVGLSQSYSTNSTLSAAPNPQARSSSRTRTDSLASITQPNLVPSPPPPDEVEVLTSPISGRPPFARRQFSSGSTTPADWTSSAMTGATSLSSGAGERPARKVSILERVLIQVTEDNDRFAVVDVSGLSTAEAIKERMFSKLRLYDDEQATCQLFRTEIGQTEIVTPPVDDDDLLALCLQIGDDKGNLKFLVQQNAPSSSRAAPVALDMLRSDTQASTRSGTTWSPRQKQRELSGPPGYHRKSESISSRSSVGDQLGSSSAQPGAGVESEWTPEAVPQGHTRGMTLQRSKATTTRRPLTGSVGSVPETPLSPRSSSSASLVRSPLSPVETTSSLPSSVQEPEGRSSTDQGESKAAHPASLVPAGNTGHRRPSGSALPDDDGNTDGRGRMSSQGSGGVESTPRHGRAVTDQIYVNDAQRRGSNASAMEFGNAPAGQVQSLGPNARTMGSPRRGVDHSGSSANLTPGPQLAATRSMEDLRQAAAEPALGLAIGQKQQPKIASPPNSGPFDFNLVHPLDSRDGRYPDASVSRVTQGRNSDGGGGANTPQGGPAPAIIRQTSADSYSHRQLTGSPHPSGYSHSPPTRYPDGQPYAHNHGIPPPRHGPYPQQHTHGYQVPHQMHVHGWSIPPQDARYSPYARPVLARPSPAATPYSSASSLGYYDMSNGGPRNQPPPINAPAGYSDRGTQVFPHRPHTYHDLPANSSPHGAYRPRPFGAQPYNQLPPQQPHPMHMQGMHMQPRPLQTREDPFTSAMFPASSSRQVTQFQRNASASAASLQPGRTVQEAMQTRIPDQHGMGLPQHAFGPRDPRDRREYGEGVLLRRPQSSYEERDHMATEPMYDPRSHAGLSQGQPYAQGPGRNAALRAFPEYAQQPGQQRPEQPQMQNFPASQPTFASERSSISSVTNSSDSHRRNHSNDEKTALGSAEDAFSAPTSARSSRSGPLSPTESLRVTNKAPPSQQTSSDVAYLSHEDSNADDDDDDDDDEELLNIRPLPRPPQQSQHSQTASGDDSPDGLENKEDDGTLRADSAYSAAFGQLANGAGGGPNRFEAPPLDDDADGDTFGTFDDDDEDTEAGTWARPLDSPASTDGLMPSLQLPLRASPEVAEVDFGERTFQPGDTLNVRDAAALGSPSRRPELRLITSPGDGNTGAPSSSGTGSGSTATATAASQLLSPLAGLRLSPSMVAGDDQTSPPANSAGSSATGINRRTSFARRDRDWAFRPPPEQLYDNLDDFFPKHDLDKPVLDASAAPGSPLAGSPAPTPGPGEEPSQAAPIQAGQSLSPPGPFGTRARHKKSIRIVAQDRKRLLERAELADGRRQLGTGAQAIVGLARRRSTKLWGQKVVEMTPGQEQLASKDLTSESPSGDSSARPIFKWVKGDLIGKGTYGRVYLALNATTGEMIAVKQVELPRTASDREDARQKSVVAALKSEIETLKDLDHPHVVSYLGFEETSSFLSIFLEYVPGGSVGSCLRKHGKFEETTTRSFIHQILEGLAYLHARGILHRDLKADNILVDFTGTCKISDFGTVRRSDDIYGNVENMSLQGSIFWMAPEVVSLSKKGYSAKVDIWSLGCVVLEMFAGRRPWSDDEAVQAMFKIGAERRAPPIPADVRLSSLAAHFLKTCFAIDPDSRPTAARLLEHKFPHTDPGWRFQTSALFRAISH